MTKMIILVPFKKQKHAKKEKIKKKSWGIIFSKKDSPEFI